MDVLYQIEDVPFYSYFVEHFYHVRVSDSVKVFICICWDDQMVFALTLLLWYIMFLDFHILHQPGIPTVSPTWSWYIILFTCCWIQFGGILLRIFTSIFIRAFHLICLVFPPFLMITLSDFGIRVALVNTEWWKCYILFYIMEQFVKDSYNSLNVWWWWFSLLSCPTLVTSWTICIARQAPLSMGFSRQEYWIGCCCLLQGIFLTQESNPGLLHCRQILYSLSYERIPNIW